jgi:NAD(P)-dependent dehydrogenase (short-subunit alcohol dehydrogenase family)
MGYYDGKVAIVTGAASGIGAGLSRALAQRGAAVVVLADIDGEGARAVADEISSGRGGRTESAQLDVREPEAFDALVQRVVSDHGRVDLLFNNAGIAVGGEILELTQEHWDRIIDVNIRGVVHGVRAVYPHMVERGDGHIVNTASLAGLGPAPLVTPYAMTKHAVVGLSTSLRIEAHDHGVRVTALCPSAIDTPLLDSRGPDDLPQPGYLDPRAYLRRGLGREASVERFVGPALRGIARNQAVVAAPRKSHAAWLAQRAAPGLTARRFRSVVRTERKERRARQAAAGVGG